MQLIANKKGMALLGVLLGMLLFTILGTTMGSVVLNNYFGAADNLEAAQAFYVAEGGMQ